MNLPWTARTARTAGLALGVGLTFVACDGHKHGEGGHDHPHPAAAKGHSHGEPAAGHGHSHGEPAAGHGHSHGEPAGDHAGDHGDAHGHGHGAEGPTEAVTRWGERVQLFVEFPFLVVGQDAPFAAHLTRLHDHLAIPGGSVQVLLSGGDAPAERFAVEGPSVAGIFRPVVRPAHPGPRTVTLTLESPVATERFEMGTFTVFPTPAEAAAAAPAEEEAPGAISYLLEQQWRAPFRLAKAEARPLRPTFPAFGRLAQPTAAVAVITAPRSGRLTAAGGRVTAVGERVARGEALFGLGAVPQDEADPATLDQAVEEATIRLQAAEREVERLKPLASAGVVPQRRLDQAKQERESAAAALRGAKRRQRSLSQAQRVNEAGAALTIPAPVAGEVAEVHASPGAWVTEGQPLARVVDRDRLVLQVDVPEAYLNRLEAVSGAWFELPHAASTFEVGREALISVGTELDPATRTLPVRFRLDNVRRELFAGMTTQAHLIYAPPTATTAVPADAVLQDQGTAVVFVQTGGETFERRPVTLGIHDGPWVEVRTGVRPGEWVVSQGAHAVKLAASDTGAIGHGHAH